MDRGRQCGEDYRAEGWKPRIYRYVAHVSETPSRMAVVGGANHSGPQKRSIQGGMVKIETIDETIERFRREVGRGGRAVTVKIGPGLYGHMRRRGIIVDRELPNPAFPDEPWILPGYAEMPGVFTPPDSSAPDWDYVIGDGGLSARG